ncbi:MAG: heavy metal translocating P-type ATPase [Clostridia bacterium]
MEAKFDVFGMTCSACSSHVEKSVKKLEGIKEVNVNLLSNSMFVKFDETVLNTDKIIEAVRSGGYDAKVVGKEKKQEGKRNQKVLEEIKNMKTRLIVSFIFLIPLMYLSMGHMLGLPIPHIFHENAFVFSFTQFLLVLPVIFVNRSFFTRGFKALAKSAPNMDSLIALGSTAATVYGIYAIFMIAIGIQNGDVDLVQNYRMNLYFESSSMILTLITLGKYLETKSKARTTDAINKLIDFSPKKATVIRNGKEEQIEVENLLVGDHILVRPGEKVAVDGAIIEGASYFDQSAITGESEPIKKSIGDQVISGSINKQGSITLVAEKVGENTTLMQIIKLVEEASSSKAPISKLADKISGIFVPVVIGIAMIAFFLWLLLGYSFEFALNIAISVLVISCPCALGLATPVSIMVATGKAAENGMLIKGAESLEILHHVSTVVLDKTGTITEGKPKVTDIVSNENIITKQDLITITASIEAKSEHPIAKAIVQEVLKNELLEVEEFEAISGKGIQGKIVNAKYYLGNTAFMQENQIEIKEFEKKFQELSEQGKTVIYIAKEQSLLGILAVADTIKQTSKEAIEELKKRKIQTIMLTGDHKKAANYIAKEVGVDEVMAQVLPQEKESKIRQLQSQGKKVAMVGDGINDSPSLARADVGIAIGNGTDIAIESADIVLVKNNLMDVVNAIDLSKETIKNIKMNLFWAFFYNTIGIPLAAGVLYLPFQILLNPMIAAAAMSLSSICVVTNALRLKNFKPKQTQVNLCKENSCVLQEEQKEKEEMKMKKEIIIEGMSCMHCTARVQKELEKVDGVEEVTVSLEEKKAVVTLQKKTSDEILRQAVEQAGYEVIQVK